MDKALQELLCLALMKWRVDPVIVVQNNGRRPCSFIPRLLN